MDMTMTSFPPSSSDSTPDGFTGASLQAWNCMNCRRRKVRCTRHHPCLPCTRNNLECVFPVSGRLPRRTRNAGGGVQPPAQKNTELLVRLRKLEALVSDLSEQVESAAAKESNSASFSEEGAQERIVPINERPDQSSFVEGLDAPDAPDAPDGLAVEGGSKDVVVSDRFWSIFCNEVEHIYNAVRDPKGHDWTRALESLPVRPPDVGAERIGYYRYLLSQSTPTATFAVLPLPAEMHLLWQTFQTSIDPFVKILHVPSVADLISNLDSSYTLLSAGIEALIFAISFAAVSILEHDDVVLTNLSASQEHLLARYRLGAENALGRADLLNTTDITVLQAFTIYLHVLQHSGEKNAVWSLTGLLVRIAARLGLHKDDSRAYSPNVTPFETEARRRLWWQVCLLDARSGMSPRTSGFQISDGMFDTQFPENVNDADIDRGPRELLTPMNNRRTDTSIFLIRCHVWRLSRRLHAILETRTAPLQQGHTPAAIDVFRQSRQEIEDGCTAHLDPTLYLDSFVLAMTALYFAELELLLAPSESSDEVFTHSLAVVEQSHAILEEPKWRPWKWNLQAGAPPWKAMATLLELLCARDGRDWDLNCERGWSSAMMVFDGITEKYRADGRYGLLSGLVERGAKHRMGIASYNGSRILPGSLAWAQDTQPLEIGGVVSSAEEATAFVNPRQLQALGSNQEPVVRTAQTPISVVASQPSELASEMKRTATDLANAEPLGHDIPMGLDWVWWDELAFGEDSG